MTDSKQTTGAAALEELLGEKLVKRTGEDGPELVPLSSLLAPKTKQIILYFSGLWCAPCRGFTPLLSDAYDTYKKKMIAANEGAETEVIFVSSDNSEEAFAEYHKKMTFPALPFDEKRNEQLMTKFGVEGIPTMVAIDGNGEVVQEGVDFRSLVDTHGADAFPLTPEKVAEFKAAEAVKTREVLTKLYAGDIPFAAKATGDETSKLWSLKDLLGKSDYVGLLLGDGDGSDDGYNAAKTVLETINTDTANRCAVVYLGGSLYNSESDHGELAKKFGYSIVDVAEELREAMKTICGGKAAAPQLLLFRRGTGLCSIDGTCEDEDVPVLVSSDPGLFKIRNAGVPAFPWDEAAMTVFEAAEKAQVEELKSKFKDMQFITEPGEGGPVVIQNDTSQRSLKERLFNGEEDAVIGLYFSAEWCFPCKMFTPKLVECYGKVKAAGKKFEVVFVSSDSSKKSFEEYYNSMVTNTGDQFLALDYDHRELKQRLCQAFEVGGIPTLVLLKPNGTVITTSGVRAIADGGADAFPWDEESIERVKAERKAAALKREKNEEEAQLASGVPVVKRLIGVPGDIKHNVPEKTLSFNGFTTAAVPGLYADCEVVYYEIEVLKKDGGISQLGFSLKDGLEPLDGIASDGVGDESTSWAVDGDRECKWHAGPTPHPCTWEVGSTIGLAANIDKGMIAVSKDGDWGKDGFGVVFKDDDIKKGVYPCLTASDYEVKYCFSTGDFKYALPECSLWDDSE